jgi:hypothetical protein
MQTQRDCALHISHIVMESFYIFLSFFQFAVTFKECVSIFVVVGFESHVDLY